MDELELALPYLHQARRKRSLAVGQEAVKRSLSRGKCRLVLLALDAGNSHRRMKIGSVPIVELADRRRLGAWLGREDVAIMAVTDPDLAVGILKRLRSD